MLFFRVAQRLLAVLCLLAGVGCEFRSVVAQNAMAPPVYARTRNGADGWGRQSGGFPRHGGYGVGGGFFQPGFVGANVWGTWYARPYPYHFDYYRYRWGGSPQISSDGLMQATDCPCLGADPAAGGIPFSEFQPTAPVAAPDR